MDDYGSCRNETSQPILVSVNGAEDHASPRYNSEPSFSDRISTTGESRKVRTSLLLGMALWIVIMITELSPFLFLVSADEYQSVEGADGADDDNDDALHAMWGSTAYNIRMCSIEECLSSPCRDSHSAPFVCLALKHDETVRGGCGLTPWNFEICSDQCDTVGCSSLLKRAEAARAASSTNGGRHHLRVYENCDVECPTDWCRKNRLCGDGENAPYQCTSGRSIYGCSSDKFEWTLRSIESECSSCCKTTSCND